MDPKKVLSPELLGSLYQFQLHGVDFALQKHGRVLIGDEMGTGKTIQAIAIAYCYKSEWPLLIICPSSLKFMWRQEILKWLSVPQNSIEVVLDKQHVYKEGVQIFIISYSCAKDLLPQWQKPWKVIISDEAHYLKNRDAKRTKVLVPILIEARRVIMLSGTPMLGRPMDIYNSAHVLRPDVFKTFREFGHRYCDPKRGRYGIEWKGASNVEELRLALECTLFIRRLKEDVLTELPGKQRQEIIVEAEGKQERKIRKLLSKFTSEEIQKVFSDDSPQDTEKAEEIRKSIITAYKLTGIGKLNAIIEFLDNLIESDVKFLFYAQHVDVLDGVEDELKKREVDFIRIDGHIPIAKRTELVDKFQQVAKCRAALLSITASSQGLTLTAGNTVVFGEYNWTPSIMDQAEDRVHRVGQVNSVNIYYLHAENTLDPIIKGILKEKQKIIHKVMNSKKEYREFQFITKEVEPKSSYVKSVGKAKPSNTKDSLVFKSAKKTASTLDAGTIKSAQKAKRHRNEVA
eukprot:TRINITY_DN2965_c0_g1_i6.p1 TRINITY_DN2965_c0_g1~~TRINITY_DN2965_c0_g1_i6.p1  ORF type:complete len:515 (-),score=134.29 TRINITY_DN2965_c0_g1_i6:64-1608(-)